MEFCFFFAEWTTISAPYGWAALLGWAGGLTLFLAALGGGSSRGERFRGARDEVRLMTVDPGHFHAALVQKRMYDRISPEAYVFAPEGDDLELHLRRIEAFNTRREEPTAWKLQVYRGSDFLERMLAEKPGNVMITAGNNRRKTEYIERAVEAGIHVLSDKPMCIDREEFERLKRAFDKARERGVLLYDVMTERYEITTRLQRELVHVPELFGEIVPGSVERPSLTKESVHYLFKYVSGAPLRRPPWYYDVRRQGEGIVDVSTHLVDLAMWELFPERTIDHRTDVELKRAGRRPTVVTAEQFERSTGHSRFPDYLAEQLDADGDLAYYCNGDIDYTLRGIHCRISVIWNFEAPEGGGDTHYSVIRGTRSEIVIRQGPEQNYRPALFVEPAEGVDEEKLREPLQRAVARLTADYPGVDARRAEEGWEITIPDHYHVGHEAHFGQVAEKYLRFLEEGKLPEWEVPNMIAKYHTTTQALELARRS